MCRLAARQNTCLCRLAAQRRALACGRTRREHAIAPVCRAADVTRTRRAMRPGTVVIRASAPLTARRRRCDRRRATLHRCGRHSSAAGHACTSWKAAVRAAGRYLLRHAADTQGPARDPGLNCPSPAHRRIQVESNQPFALRHCGVTGVLRSEHDTSAPCVPFSATGRPRLAGSG